MRVGRVYVIDWLDHCDSADTGNAWVPISSADVEPVRLRTVGYLVSSGKQAISVAHTMDGEHSTSPFTIVRRAIVSIIELALPPAKPKAKHTKKDEGDQK
ncbi:MAG: hypothetical protein IT382_22825 [Deltaproteobacteria bacterium]|nr:hypothetical protein [Deltaproteobacteria bacterium]